MRSFLYAALACASFVVPVQADDSSASLGMGGLSFAKSADIRMASEDLRISPDRVSVRFAFVNDSAKDIDTIVAFPLPDIDTWEYWNVPLGTVTDDPVNFVGFKVVVDGRPVAFAAEQRAFIKNRDVTAAVRAAGIPINIVMGRFALLDKLPLAKKKALAAAGLVEIYDENINPKWVIRTRFHWKQRFPAGKTVVIAHSYQPVTGGTLFSSYDMKAKGDDDRFKKAFCMDAPTLARLNRLLAAAAARQSTPQIPSDGMLQITTTEYILSTGNNWKGPIGRFHMTLDKLKPANTVSLCWDGLKKTGPATFEFSATNYAPTRDVRMVVIR